MHHKPGAGSLLQPTTRATATFDATSVGKRTLVGQAYRAPSPASSPRLPAPAGRPYAGAPDPIDYRAVTGPRRPASAGSDLDDALPPARRRFAPPSRPTTSISTSTALLHRAFGRRRSELADDQAPEPARTGDSATPDHAHTPADCITLRTIM